MAGPIASRAIKTLRIAAFLAIASCGPNSGFLGKSEGRGEQTAAAKVGETQGKSTLQSAPAAEPMEQAEDARPEIPAPASSPPVAAVTPGVTPAVSPAAAPAATPAANPLTPPPQAAEIFFHQGPAEDTIELYVNGVKDGQARSGSNTLRIVVKAEGEVHYWSFKVVVKGVEILANARERWIDGSIPLGTILYDQTVTFNY